MADTEIPEVRYCSIHEDTEVTQVPNGWYCVTCEKRVTPKKTEAELKAEAEALEAKLAAEREAARQAAEEAAKAMAERTGRATYTMRPGLLVVINTQIHGGKHSKTVTLDASSTAEEMGVVPTTEEASLKATKTVTVYDDPVEYEAVENLRLKVRKMISSYCENGPFGDIAPLDKEEELLQAIQLAYDEVNLFNRNAKYSRLQLYCMPARIISDTSATARGIADEIKLLLDKMDTGMTKLDAEAIEDAGRRAKLLGKRLDKESSSKVNAAVKEANKAAREIANRIEQKGDLSAAFITQLKRDAIIEARFSFLDLDEAKSEDESEKITTVRGQLDLALEAAPEATPEATPEAAPETLVEFEEPKSTVVEKVGIEEAEEVRAAAEMDGEKYYQFD
jgi:predicted NBD/HSP70 family sugar kinase